MRVQEFVKTRRQGAIELCSFISRRIKAELHYSKALQSLASTPLILAAEFSIA